MIDWLTLRLPVARLPAAALRHLRDQRGAVTVTGPSGECRKRFPSRETVETPFGSLAWKLSDHFLQLEGSPAALEAPNNVFGKRDPRHCALDMWAHFDQRHHADLPRQMELWRCTKMDVALNYPLADCSEVHEVLCTLVLTQGANRSVSTDRGTCYWNRNSALREGKAYAKGPHLDHLISKRKASATPVELPMSQILLRLELRLASKFWRKAGSPWYQWSAADVEKEHANYFMPLLANLQVTPVDGLEDRLRSVTRTHSQASAAYRTWLEIQNAGVDHVRSRKPASTFRKHRKALRDAGLTDADINTADRRLPARHTIAIGSPVHSWAELREVLERRNPLARHPISEDDDTGTVGVHRPRVLAFDGSCVSA